MTQKSLPLLLQSARDSLGDCLQELRTAVEQVDAQEREGRDTPVAPAALERAFTQCQGAMRVLENLIARTR